MENTEISRLVQQLGLKPHPEGGFYAETYRATDTVTRHSDGSVRASSTAIYYLLANGAYSAWHRIASDEVWHFYAGSPLDVHVLTPQGALLTHHMGPAIERPGCIYQATVPAGHWFAAELVDPGSFALVGCTVAPGFEFSEFELAETGALQSYADTHGDIVRRLMPKPL